MFLQTVFLATTPATGLSQIVLACYVDGVRNDVSGSAGNYLQGLTDSAVWMQTVSLNQQVNIRIYVAGMPSIAKNLLSASWRIRP
jgi:hypothetical protein